VASTCAAISARPGETRRSDRPLEVVGQHEQTEEPAEEHHPERDEPAPAANERARDYEHETERQAERGGMPGRIQMVQGPHAQTPGRHRERRNPDGVEPGLQEPREQDGGRPAQ
jgi:hypothetical protein